MLQDDGLKEGETEAVGHQEKGHTVTALFWLDLDFLVPFCQTSQPLHMQMTQRLAADHREETTLPV